MTNVFECYMGREDELFHPHLVNIYKPICRYHATTLKFLMRSILYSQKIKHAFQKRKGKYAETFCLEPTTFSRDPRLFIWDPRPFSQDPRPFSRDPRLFTHDPRLFTHDFLPTTFYPRLLASPDRNKV